MSHVLKDKLFISCIQNYHTVLAFQMINKYYLVRKQIIYFIIG